MPQSNKNNSELSGLPSKQTWSAMLSKKDIVNLAGGLDTLIEMDFEIKRKSKHKNVEKSSNLC